MIGIGLQLMLYIAIYMKSDCDLHTTYLQEGQSLPPPEDCGNLYTIAFDWTDYNGLLKL